MKKNKFVIISPMFNAASTLKQMLYSVVGQSYQNWKLILIDDCSTENQKEECKKIIQKFDDERITVQWNIEKKWEVRNVLDGIFNYDNQDDDIICRLDADDFLCDLDALKILNLVYEDIQADAIWTAHRWFDGDHISNMNISREMPEKIDPYRTPWVSSHFKTHRKYLLNNVKDENYRGSDGNYFKRIGDRTIYLPALYNAKKRLYLPMCMYSYRCSLAPETFQTEDAKFQQQEAIFLHKRGYIK